MKSHINSFPLNALVILSENENNIIYLEEKLRLANLFFCSIHIFKSLSNFYDSYDQITPSFIIVDILLLTRDDFEKIRQDFEYIPIVVLNECGQEEEVFQYISRGAQSYLVKNNFNHHQLKKTITLSYEHLALKRESEEKSKRIEYILETITDCFYALDHNWTFTYWNRAAEVALGKSKNETIGQTLFEVYPELLNSEIYHKYKRAFEEGKPIQFEYFFPTLSTWYEIQVDPSDDGLAVFFRDITRRKRNEAEKEYMIKELSKRNSDLKQFSFIASHNLRSPLTNIKAILSIIDYEGLSDSNRELLSLLEESANKLTKTIEDLSAVLLIKNKTEAQLASIKLNDAFYDVFNNVYSEYKDVTLKLDIDFRVESIYTNDIYLESIFQNLITNSIKYRHPDKELIISVRSAYSENRDIVIEFSDNGLGINLNKNKDRIFGMYQRFHSNVTGQGLGLFMVKSQIVSMGGSVEVESEENVGTTFIITLPGQIKE